MKKILLLIGYTATALGQKQYDPDAATNFSGFDEYEKPFEHDWDNIPDLVNMPEIQFWFDITNAYLQGIERGTYGNSSYVNNRDCFGPKFVTRINQFAAMTKSPNLWWHIPYMVAIIYQLYFMVGDKCKIDNTVNDFFLYCWNKGCWPEQIWANSQGNWLYMVRRILDSAIVWWEGVPEKKQEEIDAWRKLSSQTGETFSGIIKEFTGFKP